MNSPYIDKSENELSIHCLDHTDIELLYSAVINEFNNIPRGEEYRADKRKLVHLKKILENEQVQQEG